MAKTMKTTRTRSGEKRDEPEQPETPASVTTATPSPSAKSNKKVKTKATTSPTSAMKMSPPNYHFSGLPTPIIATRFDSSGTPYPPISATTIRTLKWGNARHLMLPFLSEYDKANVHKKTRTDLSKLLEARILAGDVTVKQFWDVVGLEKVQQKEKKKAPMDPFVAAALLKNKMSTAPAVAEALLKNTSSMAVRNPAAAYLQSPAKKPSLNQHHSLVGNSTPFPGMPGMPNSTPFPGMPGMPYPRPIPMAGGSPPRGPPGPMPFMPLPRPLFKYTLRIPPSIWPSITIPPGIVIGEPSPPSHLAPPSVSGTFHSSAILALGPDDQVVDPDSAQKQTNFILNKLDLILSALNATHADILSITAHVVDIHKNGEDVLAAHGTYMAGKGKARRSVCAWTMIGVSGLMPAGCVVQLEVKAIVRRGMATTLILDI